MSLVQVQGLKTYFYKGKGILSKLFGKGPLIVHAVDDVSLTIEQEETFSIVGESGCGKTTLGRAILGLVQPTEGQVLFNGQNIIGLGKEEMRTLRRKAQIILQDPRSSLNPRLTVREIIGEPFRIHGTKKYEDEIEVEVMRLLEMVGMSKNDADRYPHEFSGGQARRIGVARALALRPQFIVADEPTSGLDVSIMAAILNLMQDLKREFNLTYLWISHDLNAVKHVSDRVAIMYLGKIVEVGTSQEVFNDPKHPYTRALFSAIPSVNQRQVNKRIILKGEVPSPIHPPSGCRFRTRCSMAIERCGQEEPKLIDIGLGHKVACHRWSEVGRWESIS